MIVYADSTMRVLKLAFLNSAIIDFFSALAIAVLAVLLGLGHLKLLHFPGFYGLALWQTLAILVLLRGVLRAASTLCRAVSYQSGGTGSGDGAGLVLPGIRAGIRSRIKCRGAPQQCEHC